MKLMHFSTAEIITVESRAQSVNRWTPKPVGFWVSDEDGDPGWGTWCRENEWDCAPNAFDVTLAPDANLLWIDTVAALRQFDADFGPSDERLSYRVDWARIAQRWQGIVITPYQWPCRLAIDWYYGWDCASGCIWDAAAIASVSPAVEAVA